MAELIEACESGHDHNTNPVRVDCHLIGRSLDLGTFSRNGTGSVTSGIVLG